MVRLRTTDDSVDPAFECRLCGQRAYNEEGVRTPHPGFVEARPLFWLNPRLCECCLEVLEVGYTSHKHAGKILALVQFVEASAENQHEFHCRRQSVVDAKLAASRCGARA